MKIHRFISDFENIHDEIIVDTPDLVHQIVRVLKLQKGEKIILCDGNGKDVYAEIVETNKHFIKLKKEKEMESLPELKRKIHLYCALLKADNFDLVVQKATELGVTEITPLITHRTIRKNVREDRLQRVAQEAAEQCGRGFVPTVSPIVHFDSFVKKIDETDVNLFFDVGAPVFSGKFLGEKKEINIFIGPEGGWSEEEKHLLNTDIFLPVSISPFVLRGETAAIAACSMVAHFVV